MHALFQQLAEDSLCSVLYEQASEKTLRWRDFNFRDLNMPTFKFEVSSQGSFFKVSQEALSGVLFCNNKY